MISTMKLIKDSHFGFIVGNTPVTTSDIASFDQVRAVAEQVNNGCVKDPPQGKKEGGIQRAGKLPVLRTRHGMLPVWWTLLKSIDRSNSQPGHRSVRAGVVRPVSHHGLQFRLARYGSSGGPACSSPRSNCLKIAGMLVTRITVR